MFILSLILFVNHHVILGSFFQALLYILIKKMKYDESYNFEHEVKT